MTGKLVIETDRLWLREFVPEAAQAVFEVGSGDATRHPGW
jgi:hypothetical protein